MSRTAGSGSGPGKRAGRKTGTAPRTDFTTTTGRTAHSAKPLPYDHSPSRTTTGSNTSDDATGSAGCSTSISRSHDVAEFSGTHTLEERFVAEQFLS